MKTCMWTTLLVLAMAGVALAATAQGDAEDSVPPSVKTYAGIAVLTTILIGAIKHLWESWMKGKEPFFALGIPVILGIIGKTVAGGFADVDWTTHIIALVLSAISAGLLHDKVVNPLIKKKATDAGN